MTSSSPEPPDGTRSAPQASPEATGPIETTETRPHRVAAPEAEQPYSSSSREEPPAGDQHPPNQHDQQGRLDRPTGISWPTVVVGAVALAVGTLVLVLQTLSPTIDWSFVVPAVIVVVGTLLIVLGVVGLFTRRDHDPA
ncbi:MAG: hypothetical protein WA892_12960 [Ornithinimicrobium sp.]